MCSYTCGFTSCQAILTVFSAVVFIPAGKMYDYYTRQYKTSLEIKQKNNQKGHFKALQNNNSLIKVVKKKEALLPTVKNSNNE